MKGKSGFAGILTIIIILAIILAVGAFLVINQANKSRQDIPILGAVPEFTFTESSNRPFGLADMKGKINIVDFIFTHCQSICPVMAVKMIELYQLYEGNDMIQFVSISVDPDRDSLEVLQRYAIDVGVKDNRWVFLRAPLPEIAALSEKGFMLAADDLPAGHSSRFVLVDNRGRIRGYYDSFDDAGLDILKSNINTLLKKSS